MPANSTKKSLPEVVDAVGVYPLDAYLFLKEGLDFTLDKLHHGVIDPDVNMHVGGRQLCLGLRELALDKWGLLARTVLARWNINTTLDFGKIVFAMVQHQHLQKTEEDSLEDFRGIYDFRVAFETSYRIATGVESKLAKQSGQTS